MSLENKRLPFEVAADILNIADENGWLYAPPEEGVWDREKLETYLKNNRFNAFSLIVKIEDMEEWDSINVFVLEGKITLEIEDNFYYDAAQLESIQNLPEVIQSMVKKYNT